MLLGQNLMDDVAAAGEALHAMAFGQDLVACLWFYGFCLVCFGFCCFAGIGWGVFVSICYLLRPPIFRGVPGVWGFRAFFHNLPYRSSEDFV
jgi:fatty acid desaturase